MRIQVRGTGWKNSDLGYGINIHGSATLLHLLDGMMCNCTLYGGLGDMLICLVGVRFYNAD
jgi:hypothetical protein